MSPRPGSSAAPTPSLASFPAFAAPTVGKARVTLAAACDHDIAGRLEEAITGYKSAIMLAQNEHDASSHAEALRRLAVAHHRRGQSSEARRLVLASRCTAEAAGDELLAAQALNSLAAFDLADGEHEAARESLLRVAAIPGLNDTLIGRVRQNLGIIANIRGQFDEAEAQYQQALTAFQRGGDMRGSAMALNSLGILSADHGRWDEADARFRESIALTTQLGDVHLRGLALLSHTEVHLARGMYAEALRIAEEALRLFDSLGTVRHKAEAYRVIGVVYRSTNRLALAEARLLMAVELARAANALLEEAESARELALVFRALGRNQDALRQLNAAQRLFRRLDARKDLVDVTSRLEDLETTFLAVVREWGQSIESADSYTHGHCARVATYAVDVARMLGLDDGELLTIRIGAYLHDLGKINTPHEILNKRGRLTDEEFAIMQRHPQQGVELLADIDFPWDIKPMIRWHHEKHCGGGYPDGLEGDAIPLHAQIICIADVYDALTTTRSYRDAMNPARALAVMHENRRWWRPEVFEAFLRAREGEEGGQGRDAGVVPDEAL